MERSHSTVCLHFETGDAESQKRLFPSNQEAEKGLHISPKPKFTYLSTECFEFRCDLLDRGEKEPRESLVFEIPMCCTDPLKTFRTFLNEKDNKKAVPVNPTVLWPNSKFHKRGWVQHVQESQAPGIA